MKRRLSCITPILLVGLALVVACLAGIVTVSPACAEQAAQAEQSALININTAAIDQLATLPGIGDKTAQAIVDYRTANGPFAATEDLMNVKGVGEKKFEAIKHMITVK